jgi:hypothetical protein
MTPSGSAQLVEQRSFFAGLNLGNRAITRGACIFFVSLFLVARSGDQRRVVNLFLRSWDGPGVGWDVNNLAATAIAAAADEQIIWQAPTPS